MKQHNGKRASKPSLKIKMPSGEDATASTGSKPPDQTDTSASPKPSQVGRWGGPETGVPPNATASAAQAAAPAFRQRPRSEEAPKTTQSQKIASFSSSLPPRPVGSLYPVLPGIATREATPMSNEDEQGDEGDSQGSPESDGRPNLVDTIPATTARPQRRPWSCCRWTLHFILAELFLFGLLLWAVSADIWMQALAEVTAPGNAGGSGLHARPRQDGGSSYIFNASITSLAEASVSLGSMDKQAEDDDDVLGSIRNLHEMLIDERVRSLNLGREYKDNIVPACDSALSGAASSSALYLSSRVSRTYNSTVSLLGNLGDTAVVLHNTRVKVEKREEEVAVRLEQAKRKMDPSSSWWRLLMPSLTEGDSISLKTHRDNWALLLNQLDTAEKDVEFVTRYWRLITQAAKELNEALEMETGKTMLEGGMSLCDALAMATDAKIGEEEAV